MKNILSNRIVVIPIYSILLLLASNSYAQTVFINMSFTAVYSSAYIQLDSIKVMNRTHGGDTVIYWPDTTLTFEIYPGDTLLNIGYITDYTVGLNDYQSEKSSLLSLDSYPNPTIDQTNVFLSIPENGTTGIIITDNLGRAVVHEQLQMDKGIHHFKFTLGVSSFYFLTAHCNGITNTKKIINAATNSHNECKLEYLGFVKKEGNVKTLLVKNSPIKKESGIIDTPESNVNYTFQFATQIPCIGTPTVTYDGQIYNTIQIYSQCWLKENLNVGSMIPGSINMTDNNILEKYCYNNQIDSCTKYGGLYQWDETMQYITLQGGRGICPPGWHIPSDEEWKVLEGAADSQYGIGEPEWDLYREGRGLDAGANIKTTYGWPVGGNGTDILLFSGLPAGNRYTNGQFAHIGESVEWWSSTDFYNDYAWTRMLYRTDPSIWRDWYKDKIDGFAVRCLRDEEYITLPNNK